MDKNNWIISIPEKGGAGRGDFPSKPRGQCRVGTYNFSKILSYTRVLDSEQKWFIDKSIKFCTIDGERMRARAISYQTLHCPAQTKHSVTKPLVNTVGNINPICEVRKVWVEGTTHIVPEIVAKDRQQTLAIRWILGACFKWCISNMMNIEKCLSIEISNAC